MSESPVQLFAHATPNGVVLFKMHVCLQKRDPMQQLRLVQRVQQFEYNAVMFERFTAQAGLAQALETGPVDRKVL